MSARFTSLAERLGLELRFEPGPWLPPWLGLAAALACLVPTGAAACDVVLVPVATTVRLDYDPFAFLPTAGQLVVEVENREPEACAIDLTLLDAARIAVNDEDIDGTGAVTTFSSADPALTPTASAGVWRARLLPNARTRLAMDVRITRDAIVSAGEHGADLMMEARDAGTVSTNAPPIPVRIVLVAPPRAQMNIAGAAGTFDRGTDVTRVDFGVLAGTITRRTFVQVRSNTRARLTIDSTNQGTLRRAGGLPTEAGIAYTAELDGQPVDLTRHWEREIVSIPTIAGTSLPLDLRVQVDLPHAEGSYNDTLTLELTAL